MRACVRACVYGRACVHTFIYLFSVEIYQSVDATKEFASYQLGILVNSPGAIVSKLSF